MFKYFLNHTFNKTFCSIFRSENSSLTEIDTQDEAAIKSFVETPLINNGLEKDVATPNPEIDSNLTEAEKESKGYSFDSFIPLAICLMQGSAALATEIICLILIQGQRNVMDTIMNYVAFGIIADIDNLFSSINKDRGIQVVLSEEEWAPKVMNSKVKY